MFKLTAFFLILWLGMVFLSGILAGGGGIVVTYITDPVDDDDVAFNVADTTGLLDSDTMQIGGEKIYYTGTTATSLTGITRGYEGTEAKAHADNAQIYTEDAGAMNSALGFNVPLLADSMGWVAFIAIPVTFITTTIPRAIAYNYNFLQGDMFLVGLLFFALGAAFIFTLAWSVIGARRV